MTLKEAKEVIEKVETPIMLWGPPGVGKSAIINQIAQDHGWKLIDVRLTLLDPTDVRGLPYVDQNVHQTRWAPPVFFPKDSGPGILFLDELPSSPPLVQAACYQLLLDRKVGEYALPDGWKMVAAGNHYGEGAIVFRMPTPIVNRLIHLVIDPDLEVWKEWAIENEIHPAVLAFLSWRPEYLYQVSKDPNRPFPSPRSWEFASRVLKSNLNQSLEHAIKGCIGEGVGTEFLTFMKLERELPPIKEYMQGKIEVIDIPQEPSLLFFTLSSIVSITTKGNLDRALNLLNKIPAEFKVVYLRDLMSKSALRTLVIKSTQFDAFVKQHGKDIMGD